MERLLEGLLAQIIAGPPRGCRKGRANRAVNELSVALFQQGKREPVILRRGFRRRARALISHSSLHTRHGRAFQKIHADSRALSLLRPEDGKKVDSLFDGVRALELHDIRVARALHTLWAALARDTSIRMKAALRQSVMVSLRARLRLDADVELGSPRAQLSITRAKRRAHDIEEEPRGLHPLQFTS